MLEGYYSAVTAMAAMVAEQQIIGNNLANINTVGYKQDIPQSQQFDKLLLLALRRDRGVGAVERASAIVGRAGAGLELLPVAVDLTDGPVAQTNRPLDLAIIGNGFFRLRGANGEDTYMRAGAFDIDVEGTLVNRFGEALLDVDGNTISVGNGDLRILTDGQLLLNGQLFAQLALFDLPEGSDWKKIGGSHFAPAGPTDTPVPTQSLHVLQGFLEQSNVDAEFQSAEMLSTLRLYEAAQALLRMQDESLAQAVREVGRVG